MHSVTIDISPVHARKLIKGGTIQLPHTKIASKKGFEMVLHPENAKKIARALRNSRGVRLSISADEISASGLREWLQQAGKDIRQTATTAGKYYVQKIRPKYGKYVKQGVTLAKEGAIKGVEAYAPWTIPALEYADDKYGDRLINKLGKVSGAYGLTSDVVAVAKKAGQAYTKYAKKHVAPHLKKAATTGRKKLVAEAKKRAPGFAKEIEALDKRFGERAVVSLGRVSGAYGLVPGTKGRLNTSKSTFLDIRHPSMMPTPLIAPGRYNPNIKSGERRKGGSFKTVGAGYDMFLGKTFAPHPIIQAPRTPSGFPKQMSREKKGAYLSSKATSKGGSFMTV